MKVRGWLADESACGWYRLQQPFEALRKDGFDAVESVTLTGNDMIDADLTVVQRTSSPLAVYLMETAKAHDARFVYEVDDLLMHIDPANPVAAHYAQPLVQASIEYAIDMCDAVTVSTIPLADEMGMYGKPVHVLPNCLPDYFTGIGRHAGAYPQDQGGQILWAGSATHHGDFGKEVRYGLSRAVRYGAEFTCKGFDYRAALGVAGRFCAWDEDIPSFHQSLGGRYNIGLCPLARTRFNGSKSGIKAMEYQAAGVVPVATDCPAYRAVIEHGVTGFLCRTQEQWKDALCTLAADTSLRNQLRNNCLSLTASRTYGANAWRWAHAYRLIQSGELAQPN